MDPAQSAKILGVSITPSSASRLCGRIWFVGFGAFAPESWVRSASRPYLGPFDSRGFAPFAGLLPNRQRTAVATMLPSPCPRASVRAPVFTQPGRPFYTLCGFGSWREDLLGDFTNGLGGGDNPKVCDRWSGEPNLRSVLWRSKHGRRDRNGNCREGSRPLP